MSTSKKNKDIFASLSCKPSFSAPLNFYVMCQRLFVAVIYTTKKFNKPTKRTKAIQTPEPTHSSFLDSTQF